MRLWGALCLEKVRIMYDPYYDIPDRDARRWAMFCHFGGLARLTGVPFAPIIVPLIIWLAKRDEHPFIDDQGKEALNFQISMTIYIAICWVLVAALSWILIGFLFIPVGFLLMLGQVVGSLYGGIKANDGLDFRYPFTIRFLK